MSTRFDDEMETWRILIDRGIALVGFCNGYYTETTAETMVIFWHAHMRYGIPTCRVSTIEVLGPYTPLPFTHPCILGVVQRGENMIVVLDVRSSESGRKHVPHTNAEVLMVQLDGTNVGLLTDGVLAAPRWMYASAMHFEPV